MYIFTKLIKIITAFALFFLTIQLNAQITISGYIHGLDGAPLSGFDIEATNIGAVQTDGDGYYEFDVPSGYTGMINPISPMDFANGVTITDLLIIRAHILGISLLDNPYKLLAADANSNGLISTLDFVHIGNVADGINDDFNGQDSWKFLDANFVFSNPNNPWAEPIPNTNSINNLTEDLTLNFIGIKVGDVDCSAINGANTVTGSFFNDSNENCINDDAESVPTGWTAALQGANNYFQVLNNEGNFIIFAPAGDYTLEIFPPNEYWEPCQSSMPITIGEDPVELEIGAQKVVDCPLMEVNLSTPFLRRCFESNYSINYCNQGTALAEDATVTVQFDPFLEVVSTSATPSNIDGNTYIFDLGDVEIGECGLISAVVYASCEAELGQTHCTEAFITPDEWCFPSSALYSGADLELTGTCEDDEVKFIIQNVGDAMTEAVDYIIIEDLLVKQSAQIQLGAGELFEMSEASNGTTCRLEVEQIANHPLGHQLIAFVEGCGTHPDGSVSLGFVTQFPFDGGKPFTDIDCRQNIGSYDPNDIQGFPRGYTDEHLIDKGQELEYLIRFQNTGTDTAFNVRVENPLSLELDWSSFRPLVGSHDFEYVFENDKVIFLFKDIMLPDSNVNEATSHGFIRYAIDQKADLQIGDVINNKAGIFFDFNDPVITNTAFHTIAEPIFTVEATEIFLPNLAINYFPNPVTDMLTIELESDDFRSGELEVFDAQGKKVQVQKFEATSLIISTQNLTNGLYFFHVSINGKQAGSGKLVKQ